ncbi:MAG: hypothetical protein ACI9QC_000381 [Oceanicoccus sp.]|jgi:hypothetical protein
MAVSQKNPLPRTIAYAAALTIGVCSVNKALDPKFRDSIQSEVLSTMEPNPLLAERIYRQWSADGVVSEQLCRDSVPGENQLFNHISEADDRLDGIASPEGARTRTETRCATVKGELTVEELKFSFGPLVNRTTCEFSSLGPVDVRLTASQPIIWDCNSLAGDVITATTTVESIVLAIGD